MITILGGVDMQYMGQKKNDNFDLFEFLLIDELNMSI